MPTRQGIEGNDRGEEVVGGQEEGDGRVLECYVLVDITGCYRHDGGIELVPVRTRVNSKAVWRCRISNILHPKFTPLREHHSQNSQGGSFPAS